MKISFRFPATAASEATRARRRRSLLLAVVGIVVLPLAWRGPSCGQDFDFHLQNWLEVARAWHQGVLYPRWAASANYGAGEPRFVFYPPLSWLLGAALGSVLPWAWTPVAFALLALLGAGWSFRAMANEWTHPPEGAPGTSTVGGDNAALAACLYVVNPYMLFVLYERGALAELLAAVWMPLLVLYGLRKQPALVPLALVIAALWLTNAPAAVMGCYMLAALVAVASLRERSFRLVGRAVGGVALGLGMAAFWLIPAVYEQRWVEIRRAIGPLMRVEDSFLFGMAQPPRAASSQEVFDVAYHNQVLHTASWITLTLIVATAIAAWLARKKRTALWLPLVVMGAGIAALQFRRSDFVWRVTPELKFLQFPWRWMLVLGMIFAALTGLAFRREAMTRRAIGIRAAVILLLAGGLAGMAAARFWQPCDDEDNLQAQRTTLHDGGFQGTDEYTPKGADNDAVQVGLPLVRVLNDAHAEESAEEDNPDWAADKSAEIAADVKTGRWTTGEMRVVVTTPQAGYAVLRLMDYPAWRVTRNGAEVSQRMRRSDGLMVIPVEAGANRIEVHWHDPADARTGIGLSLGALAITLACGWKGRRRLNGTSFR